MPNTAARTSARDLGRKSAKQAATRARTRASQEGGSLLHASERRDDGDLDHVVHEVVETTKFRASASPSNAFAPVSHSGPVEHPDENAPPGMAIKEDPHVHQDPAETYHPESASYFPGGPLTWEWDGPEDFAQDYEPQGELLNEAGDRRSLEQQDFSFREVTADSPQIQSYFSNQFRGSTLDHPQLPDQSLQRRPPQPGSDSRQPAFHTTGDKRKSITAIEGEAGGASGDPAPKRVAFSPEETGGAPEQAIANLQAQHHRNGGILRRGSEGPASNATQAPASRPDSTTQQEEPVSKRAKPSSRRDRPGEKKMALPAGKVFPIQIGSELFRLSGASISSDAPSYFSDFFTEQLRSTDDGSAASIKTLYIDRDPITFRDISLHLQGYHVQPRDGEHFVKLFADAQFYSLPRLITQLYTSSIFIQIGERHFQIDRAIFDHPGDNPNYFSLGFAIFFSTPNEVFPGLDNRGLLRPPSILPPAVPGRSADIFAELVQILQGYQVHIRNEEHRDALLRDARYFHLKGVEQKLIPHHISFNHTRHHFEIVLRLQDIRQSGISFVSDALGAIAGSDQTSSTSPAEGDSTGSASRPSPAPSSTSNPAIPATSTSTFARHLSSSTPGGGVGVGPTTPTQPGPGWVHYARPYVDEHAHALVLEIGDEATRLDLSTSPARASFSGRTHNRVAALLTVVAKQMNLPAAATGGLMMLQQSSGASGGPTAPPNVSSPGGGLGEEQRVKVFMEADADVVVDGVRWDPVIGAPVGATAVGGGAVEGPEEYEAIFEFEGREGRGRARRRRRLDGDDEGGGGIGGGLARRGIGGGGGGSEGGLGSKVWMVKNGHWRLRAQQDGRGGMEVVLVAVKIEAYASERQRNAQRGFLG